MSDTTGIASVDQVVVWSVAITAIIGLLAWVVRAVRRIGRAMDNFAEDWQGAPARPGVPARSGVMARLGGIEQSVGGIERRLDSVEHELHPNSGSSLRDAVDRVEEHVRPAR